MADDKKPEPCPQCGGIHNEDSGNLSSELDGELIAKELLGLISDYAMKRGIAATSGNLYVVGNAVARVGTQLCFEAGNINGKLEPLRQLVQVLKKGGEALLKKDLEEKMKEWPQA